jgi:hypothetical protein
MNKYITVLDFEVGRVFQYKIKSKDDNYERFITDKGHRLSNIEWMAHEIAEILGPTIVDIRSERLANNDGDYDGGECSVCGTTAPRIFNTN